MQVRTRSEAASGAAAPRHFKGSYLARVVAVSVIGLGALTGVAGPAVASPTSAKVEVKMASVAKYGQILVNTSGLPLYYDAANKPGKWACTGSCLAAWPPLTLPKSQKAAVAAKGVTGLGTVKSPSGVQVTWHGKALYTFAEDSKGKVTGQGISDFFVAHVSAAAKTATAGGATPTTAAKSSWG